MNGALVCEKERDITV